MDSCRGPWEYQARILDETNEERITGAGANHEERGHVAVRQIRALAGTWAHDYRCRMPTVNEIEKLALELPETDRAVLASSLLDSLSPVLDDEDEGVAEALRRDAELEADPSLGLSLDQLDQRITQRRQ